MRYITIPSPVPLCHPETGDPVGGELSFAQGMGGACANMINTMDALGLIDLRRKLTRAPIGSVVELTEEEWGALSGVLKRPTFFQAAYLFAAEPHLRAVLDAPTTKPVDAHANGSGAPTSEVQS